MTISFLDARRVVTATVAGMRRGATELVPLDDAAGRLLGENALSDRPQPPFHRVTRDGFAVRSGDVSGASRTAPVALDVIGEAPPGRTFAGAVRPGTAVEIMTGAPLPQGADAVVMVEHTERAGEKVLIGRPVSAHENVVACGSELPAGAVALPAGRPLDPAAVALLASIGLARPRVGAAPRVAILATGDELVDLEATPTAVQIRNSNRHSLTAQVRRAGGVPLPRPIAKDDPALLREAVGAALAEADLLLVSGGVSMGKYDFVEGALAAHGARVAFDAVAIRPGKPLVFGDVAGKPFFGLPGNPLSTIVTFELFVRPALAIMGGAPDAPLRYSFVPLAAAYEQRALPLTAFVPARYEGEGDETRVVPLANQGSGDLAAMARADCLLVLPPETTRLEAGAFVAVLPK